MLRCHRRLLGVLLLLLASACTPSYRPIPSDLESPRRNPTSTGPESPAEPVAATPASPPPAPPPLLREFRGAWVATVANIDWPSQPGLPTATARAELEAIVQRAVALRLNALVFQVRPAADAMYASTKEPWAEWLTGTQGKAPEPLWDPLQFLLERCHQEGLQLHAWFNPFRARHLRAQSKPAPSHIQNRLPEAVLSYGNYRWMDPSQPRAAAWSLDVIRDVVDRYDIDGVHLDDYFYPYPEGKRAFPDERSYAAYQRSGGKLSLGDWRRGHVDRFVATLYDTVHRRKPWVLVGISPFGIARPNEPSGIQAGIDQYRDLHADPVAWLRNGQVDYLAPQLYWPIDQTAQSFERLLPYWLAQNVRQRHVWPGLDISRIRAGKPPVRPTELRDQLALLRGYPGSQGHLLYSFQALASDHPAIQGTLASTHALPAAIPASPWLGSEPPPAPQVTWPSGRSEVSWRCDANVRQVALQLRTEAGWRTERLGPAHGSARLPEGTREVAVTAFSRTMVASAPARKLAPPP